MSGAVACGTEHGVGLVVAAVFAALSLHHVYWALGGTVGLDGAIPELPAPGGNPANPSLAKAFRPTAATTLLVAVALATVSALVSLRAGLFSQASTHALLRGMLAAVALLLTARAVGDFHWVGFFKRVKGSRFATRDTWLYSPLCGALAIGIASLALSPGCRA